MKKIDNSYIHRISLLLKKQGYSVSFSYDHFDKTKVVETSCCIESHGLVCIGRTVKHPKDQQNLKRARSEAFDRALELFCGDGASATASPVELLPCPFCGKSETVRVMSRYDIEGIDEGVDFFATICSYTEDGCGSSSGYRDSAGEARALWNRRKK